MKETSGTPLVGTYVQDSAPHDLQRTSTNRPQAPVSSAYPKGRLPTRNKNTKNTRIRNTRFFPPTGKKKKNWRQFFFFNLPSYFLEWNTKNEAFSISSNFVFQAFLKISYFVFSYFSYFCFTMEDDPNQVCQLQNEVPDFPGGPFIPGTGICKKISMKICDM